VIKITLKAWLEYEVTGYRELRTYLNPFSVLLLAIVFNGFADVLDLRMKTYIEGRLLSLWLQALLASELRKSNRCTVERASVVDSGFSPRAKSNFSMNPLPPSYAVREQKNIF